MNSFTNTDRSYKLDLDDDSYSGIFYFSEKSHKLPFFPYCAGKYKALSQYYTINHKLEGFLAMFTIAGSGSLEVGGNQYVLDSGSFVLIDCKEPHKYYTNGDFWEFYWFRFSGTAAQVFCDMISTRDFGIDYLKNIGSFRSDIDYLINLATQNTTYASVLESKLINDLLTKVLLSRMSADAKISPTTQGTIYAVMNYIKYNYSKGITVEDIAAHVYLNPSYLARLFKRSTGTTLSEALLSLRINAAKDILLQTETKVKDIAEKVGFRNVNAFIRAFQKATGMTPMQYKISMERTNRYIV